MNSENQEPLIRPSPQRSTALAVVYGVICRHKWLICLFAMLGLGGSAGVYFLTPAEYTSEARLLVRYIVESKSIDTVGTVAADFRPPDPSGESVLNSETMIITSQDLAERVVDAVGAARILEAYDGGTNGVQAASLIRYNLQVEVPLKSNILLIRFSHRDQEMAVTILKNLVTAYLRKHVEIHHPLSVFDDFLTQQTDRLRLSLKEAEDQLRDLKSKAGVISLEEARKAVNQQLIAIKNSLLESEVTLAQEKAALDLLERVRVGPDRSATNPVSPHLSGTNTLANSSADAESPYPQSDRNAQRVKVAAFEARMKVLSQQYLRLNAEATNVESVATAILQLQRKRDLDESNFVSFSRALEQARTDEALGAGMANNIGRVQEPSPPVRMMKKVERTCLGILLGSIGSGLVLLLVSEGFSRWVRPR